MIMLLCVGFGSCICTILNVSKVGRCCPEPGMEERGCCSCATAPFAHPIQGSLDHQSRDEAHGPRQIVEVGRGRHDSFVDLGELFSCGVTLDTNGVVELLVALRHCGIDPEKAAEVDLAVGLYRQ